MLYLLLGSVGLGLLATWIRRGSLEQLGEVSFRLWWVVPAVALAQSYMVRGFQTDSRLPSWHVRPVAMVGSYIALWGVVGLNRQLPGMKLVFAGIALNGLAIAANGGYMPILPEAWNRISLSPLSQQLPLGSVVLGSKDVLLPRQEAVFWFLGDILVIPKPFPRPTAMSVGDVFIAIGIFVLIVQTTWSQKKRQSEP